MFNIFMQIGLTGFTLGGFLFTSLKMPEYGLVLTLISQLFWLYSAWKAGKDAHQWGIFITTIFVTCIVIYGVINYWFL